MNKFLDGVIWVCDVWLFLAKAITVCTWFWLAWRAGQWFVEKVFI